MLVSGGLQDNGGSLVDPRAGKMVSNFGGDGGDVLVDPNNGCNIVQEYVVLSMTLTQTCGIAGRTWRPDRVRRPVAGDGVQDRAPRHERALHRAVRGEHKRHPNEWLAGGSHLWVQNKGFAIRSGAGWGAWRRTHSRMPVRPTPRSP